VDFSDESGNDRGPIESRSTDGLQVKFSVQFQYTLNRGSLIDLYQRYGEDYRSPCIRYAVDILNDRATNFTASQFFQDLGSVQEDMRKAIVNVWDGECFATITTVQVSRPSFQSTMRILFRRLSWQVRQVSQPTRLRTTRSLI